MNNNDEPERDPAVESDYSVEEAEQMGAFVEDAISFEDVRGSIEDFEPETPGSKLLTRCYL
jgi:hypothetical protein